MAESNRENYAEYAKWKGWEGNPDQAVMGERYAAEMRRARLPDRSRILEIGFGDGAFLDWAKQNGHAVVGVEILSDCVARARARGHTVFCEQITGEFFDAHGPFDAVCAFDVFEHIPMPQLIECLRTIGTSLPSGGLVIARCPNPVGFAGHVHQFGDITHCNFLTADSMRQIAAIVGLELISAENAARSYRGGRNPAKAAFKRAAYVLRDLLEIFLGTLYFGHRIPLDSDLTYVLRKPA